MSDLFIILGIVAALLIGGVAIYNKVQERNYRKRSEEAFHQRHDDVLLGEESPRDRNDRIEPGLTDVVSETPIELRAQESEASLEMDRPWVSNEENANGRDTTARHANDVIEPRAHTSVGFQEPETSAAPPYERKAAPRQPQPPAPPPQPRDARSSIPPGSLRESPTASVPPGSVRESARTIPPLRDAPNTPKTSIPPGALREPGKSSIPPGSVREPSKASVPASGSREPARSPIPPLRDAVKSSSSPVDPREHRAAHSNVNVPRTPTAESVNDRRHEASRPVRKAPEFDPPHPSLDYVARIELEKPLPASAFAQVIFQTRDLGKPVRFAGVSPLNGTGEELNRASPTTYKQVVAGLQMADRSGPASDVQIARFGDILRRAATGLKARAICPPLHQALASAIELDQFCADVDITIGLNIVARRNQPFPGSRLAALAEAIGFKLGANGKFEFTGNDGNVIFSLCDQDGAAFSSERLNGTSIRGVTLLLDVPRVADGVAAFETMITLANDLCEPLEGALVDDNGKPLSERGVENIRVQLRDIYDKMQARQISAGSTRARRLFS